MSSLVFLQEKWATDKTDISNRTGITEINTLFFITGPLADSQEISNPDEF
jgi:hypothetical protein